MSKLSALFLWLLLLSPFILGGLWVYTHVSACGWKGLFVECRIMDCPK